MALLAAGGATYAKEHQPVKLRKWQAKATETAFINYSKGRKLFVTEACTGAGKTRHGVETAVELMKSKSVDLVIVLTPSIATRSGWKDAFNKARASLPEIRVTDDNEFPVDTNVWVTTYSGYEAAQKALATAPVRLGVFTVVDEYHHAEQDAAWGIAVEALGGLAKHALFLSGTPWKQSGFCPLLVSQSNIHGKPYYDSGDIRVSPDFVHDYSKDLIAGEDRATHWVAFKLLPSIFTYENENQEKFELPDLENMSNQERLEWEEKAAKDKTPLGKHVKIKDNMLTGRSNAKELLSESIALLAKCRADTYQACGQRDLPIMLVVAQNVKAARSLADYIEEIHELKTVVIVSEDQRSHEVLEKTRTQCADNSPDKPDVIVSVGMISEGVDIPQIKVIAYLSAVLTTLYLVQVIGRALRRMFVPTRKGFADSHASQITAHFVAIAHPKICYVASRIEQQMSDAQAAKGGGGDGGDGPEPTPVEGTADTTDERLNLLRGQVNGAQWQEAIEGLKTYEKASECFLDNAWCAYVLGLALNGDKSSQQRAMALTQDMCKCLGINYEEIWQHVSAKADHSLSYDQEQKLLRKQAQYLTNIIRWKCKPFCDDPENDKAYMTVRSALNRIARFPRGLGFAKASLEQKREWIKGAEKVVKEGKTK
jgi:superfamily II DNA or RNA helicase